MTLWCIYNKSLDVYHKIPVMGNSTNSLLFYFFWSVNIIQIVLMLSSLWTAVNAVLVYYVWYTSFSRCLYIFKFLKTANNAYIFVCFIFTLCLKSLQWLLFFNQFVRFTSCDGEFLTLRFTVELQSPHGFLKRSVLKSFDMISKSITA